MENTKSQAERLYFQTNLSQSQIAEALNISRTTLHDWVTNNEWARLKRSAKHMPIILAESCHIAMGTLCQSIMSEKEGLVSKEDVRMLASLERTATNLTKHSALTATIQLRHQFLDWVAESSTILAESLQPLIDGFIKSQARIKTSDIVKGKAILHPDHFPKDLDIKEACLDIQDVLDWKENPSEATKPETSSTLTSKPENSSTLTPKPTLKNSPAPALTLNNAPAPKLTLNNTPTNENFDDELKSTEEMLAYLNSLPASALPPMTPAQRQMLGLTPEPPQYSNPHPHSNSHSLSNPHPLSTSSQHSTQTSHPNTHSHSSATPLHQSATPNHKNLSRLHKTKKQTHQAA